MLDGRRMKALFRRAQAARILGDAAAAAADLRVSTPCGMALIAAASIRVGRSDLSESVDRSESVDPIYPSR
jgi:hypothetical protein